ncbi:MAG: hypothetical protein K6B75_00055, partial [Lachnospiraceae bacterium]|nr:hypothetical protein [Lachnospiraceae bacterium]
MKTFKELKKAGRENLKRHYLLFIALILLASAIGTSLTGFFELMGSNPENELGQTVKGVFTNIFEGNIEEALEIASGNKENLSGESYKIFGLEFGHQDGVLSDFVNMQASGSFFAALASIILNISGSATVVVILFSAGAFFFLVFFVVFISETYRVIYTRMFLEGRVYSRVDTSTLTYLLRLKKWKKVSLAYLHYNIRLFLWFFTLVGLPVKFYAYS